MHSPLIFCGTNLPEHWSPLSLKQLLCLKTISLRFTSTHLQFTMNTNKNEIDVVTADERISNQIEITAKEFLIVTQVPRICSESFFKRDMAQSHSVTPK